MVIENEALRMAYEEGKFLLVFISESKAINSKLGHRRGWRGRAAGKLLSRQCENSGFLRTGLNAQRCVKNETKKTPWS